MIPSQLVSLSTALAALVALTIGFRRKNGRRLSFGTRFLLALPMGARSILYTFISLMSIHVDTARDIARLTDIVVAVAFVILTMFLDIRQNEAAEQIDLFLEELAETRRERDAKHGDFEMSRVVIRQLLQFLIVKQIKFDARMVNMLISLDIEIPSEMIENDKKEKL